MKKEGRLSKIETLTLAKYYIASLTGMILRMRDENKTNGITVQTNNVYTKVNNGNANNNNNEHLQGNEVILPENFMEDPFQVMWNEN